MNNPDTLATFGTHDTGRRQTQPKTIKMINTDPTYYNTFYNISVIYIGRECRVR